jgi:hypothetical protein
VTVTLQSSDVYLLYTIPSKLACRLANESLELTNPL